uniref:Uncharacterized protein n=1 Tax=Cacopsylla melanoneura TaxID=428564 RepID=A0A8D8SQT8_9HEMI
MDINFVSTKTWPMICSVGNARKIHNVSLSLKLVGKIFEKPCEHCHPSFETKDIQRQHINNQLKRKAVENICDRPLKILHQHLSQLPDDALIYFIFTAINIFYSLIVHFY